MKLAFATLLVLVAVQAASAAELELISLPPLQIDGRAARAHTQGLEIVGGHYYVTARRDDVRPKRALLLRTARSASQAAHWDIWDITPNNSQSVPGNLDHSGGLQSDGKRLWIPVAQSVRHGQSVIRVFALDRLAPSQPATPELEFAVADHIGALAVFADRQLVFGASWDTETIYVWNFEGRLQRTLRAPELQARNLGLVPGPGGHAGIAVQDWKMVDDHLFASGLFGDPASPTVPPKSRLLVCTRFLEPEFECQTIRLPLHGQTELAEEAMAISGGFVQFIPEDLGATNRLFRTPLATLLNRKRPATRE